MNFSECYFSLTNRWKIWLLITKTKIVDDANKIAKKINALEIKIKSKVGEGKKLFGSVNNSNVQNELKENGVEIDNYKSNDIIHYGPLSEIDVTSGGKNYDIINPPILTLSDKTGVGCSAICEVEGNIQRIDVVDSGFDYLTTPTLKIDGGNGTGRRSYL